MFPHVRSLRIAPVLLLALLARGAHARAEASLSLTEATNLAALERALSQSSPELASAQGDVRVAQTELAQSRRWDNPRLDVTWSTLPLGRTTPPELERPYAQVPSYGVQLSYPFLAGKRGPRIDAAAARARASAHGLRARIRALSLELAAIVGEVASSTLRREGLRALIEDARHDLLAAEARFEATFGTQLEVERLSLEKGRVEQQLLAAEAAIERALSACTALAGVRCEPFPDASAARRFFERWLQPAVASYAPGQRPDLAALAELARASEHDARHFRATRLPDPTLTLGYLHDRFVVSGNQRNSLNLGLSLPLPLVDRGELRAQAARERASALRREHAQRGNTARATIQQLVRELASERSRQQQLSETLVPRATRIVDTLEEAVQKRLVPLTDLIQARRALDELLLQESGSYVDAFRALLELTAQTGGEP